MTGFSLAPWLCAWAAALLVAWFLVLTKNWHGKFSMDSTHGVQKFHEAPTPRIGGVAIAAGLLAAWWCAQGEVKRLLGLMLLAGVPAFIFGIAEDLTKRVGVSWRLLATICSGLLACYLMDTHLTRVNIVGVDKLFAFAPLAIAFTAFAVGGVANAVNIIDGFNGLSGGVYCLCMGTLGFIAYRVGDTALAQVCLLLCATGFGFLVMNFPFGKIFLGDGGAYLLGFLLAWMAILLPMRNAQVSVWATLLACAYPVLETFFSMWRKHQREGHHPGQPDKVHFHMLMHRRVAKPLFGHLEGALRNGYTSPFCWLFAFVPAALAYGFFDNTVACALGFAFSALLYALVYNRLAKFRWQLP